MRALAAVLACGLSGGCGPVGPERLRRLRLSFWGFDGRPHVGTIVVHESVVTDVETVFRTLFQERFPIRQMQPVDAYRGSDPDSMAADNTSAFNCRAAVAPGPVHWSAHAYGKAVDVNTVENPYLDGTAVRPAGGRVRGGRLEVGRPLAVVAGLSALQPDGRLRPQNRPRWYAAQMPLSRS